MLPQLAQRQSKRSSRPWHRVSARHEDLPSIQMGRSTQVYGSKSRSPCEGLDRAVLVTDEMTVSPTSLLCKSVKVVVSRNV
jgi:hypothetical protein